MNSFIATILVLGALWIWIISELKNAPILDDERDDLINKN